MMVHRQTSQSVAKPCAIIVCFARAATALPSPSYTHPIIVIREQAAEHAGHQAVGMAAAQALQRTRLPCAAHSSPQLRATAAHACSSRQQHPASGTCRPELQQTTLSIGSMPPAYAEPHFARQPKVCCTPWTTSASHSYLLFDGVGTTICFHCNQAPTVIINLHAL
jgi:hypothetical protein